MSRVCVVRSRGGQGDGPPKTKGKVVLTSGATCYAREQVNVSTWLRADKVNPTLEELQRFKSRKKKDPE